MCKASSYLSELQSLTRRIHNDREVLRQKHSEYDKMLSETYHQIENANFNACEGYYHAKRLQEILRQRRIVKDELHKIDMLHQSLNRQGIPKVLKSAKSSLDKAVNTTTKKYKTNWKYTYDIEDILQGGEISETRI